MKRVSKINDYFINATNMSANLSGFIDSIYDILSPDEKEEVEEIEEEIQKIITKFNDIYYFIETSDFPEEIKNRLVNKLCD
jgi:hypothetical protein